MKFQQFEKARVLSLHNPAQQDLHTSNQLKEQDELENEGQEKQEDNDENKTDQDQQQLQSAKQEEGAELSAEE